MEYGNKPEPLRHPQKSNIGLDFRPISQKVPVHCIVNIMLELYSLPIMQ
jgi:hypothetical protein